MLNLLVDMNWVNFSTETADKKQQHGGDMPGICNKILMCGVWWSCETLNCIGSHPAIHTSAISSSRRGSIHRYSAFRKSCKISINILKSRISASQVHPGGEFRMEQNHFVFAITSFYFSSMKIVAIHVVRCAQSSNHRRIVERGLTHTTIVWLTANLTYVE